MTDMMLHPAQILARNALIANTNRMGIFSATTPGAPLRLVRPEPDSRRLSLPGGFVDHGIYLPMSSQREFEEESSFSYSQRFHLVWRLAARIASRHGVTDLKVRAEADRPRQDIIVVSIGKGARMDIFATRPTMDAATLFGLVFMHLDQWLMSRKTMIIRSPRMDAHGSLYDAGRMRRISDVIMRQAHAKAV